MAKDCFSVLATVVTQSFNEVYPIKKFFRLTWNGLRTAVYNILRETRKRENHRQLLFWVMKLSTEENVFFLSCFFWAAEAKDEQIANIVWAELRSTQQLEERRQ